MIVLETFLRSASVALLLVLIGLLARDVRHLPPARYGVLLAIAATAMVIVDSPSSFLGTPEVRMALFPISLTIPVFIWWFARSLFDDDFRLGPLEWSVAGIYAALGLLNFDDLVARAPLTFPQASLARTLIAIGVAAHIIYLALMGRQADLVERRRRVRSAFALSIVALLLLVLATEARYGLSVPPAILNVPLLLGLLGVIVAAFVWLARIDGAALTFDAPDRMADRQTLTPKESAAHARLLTVMTHDKAYLESELTIGKLAERVEIPEHQLRALINKSLGFRNFRAFLNHYRLDHIKKEMADPAKVALPILTLAMDAGFASLASFNRAFKSETGQTPSAFRAAALQDAAPDQN